MVRAVLKKRVSRKTRLNFKSSGHPKSNLFNDSQSIDMSFWPELQLLNLIEK